MEKNYIEGSFLQVHIISAGSGMNETFKTALKKYSISSVIVFRETSADGKGNNKIEEEINKATSEMRSTAENLDISFEVKHVRQNDISDVRDQTLNLTKEHNNGKFFFNLTHGRKVLPLFLLTMAVWLDGTPYYIDKEQEVIEINIPRMHAEEIASNKNFFSMLKILHEHSNKGERWVRYKDAYAEISKIYVSNKDGKGGRSEKLSMGTYSKWVRRLVEAHLLEQKFEDGSYKQKVLRLTGDGTFTFMFLKDQFS